MVSLAIIRLLSAIFIVAMISGCNSNTDPPTDPPSLPNLSVGDIAIAEQNFALFVVSLSKAADGRVMFNYQTEPITATPGDDYVSASGRDTILAGQLQTTVTVFLQDDTKSEPSETFSLIVSSLSGALPSDTVGVATILDNEPAGVSFVNDVQPVLRGSCALNTLNCHGSSVTFPGGGMSLGEVTYAAVRAARGSGTGTLFTDSLIVQPGDSMSTLYAKLKLSTPFGARMPYAQPPLDTASQRKIRDWILEGAQDN